VTGLIRVSVALLILYLLLTGLAGFDVGRRIYAAKTNPFVGLGASMAGRDATESFAIEELRVPRWVRESPSFWLTLRLAE
jgi:hypothetical protein